MLDWSGHLLHSFRRGGEDHIREVSDTRLHWGSRVPYARFLARRRPMLLLDEATRRLLIREPIRLYVQGAPPGAIEAIARARAGLWMIYHPVESSAADLVPNFATSL